MFVIYRRHKSEYELNFRSPMEYEYLEGAWRGADPPHIENKVWIFRGSMEGGRPTSYWEQGMNI